MRYKQILVGLIASFSLLFATQLPVFAQTDTPTETQDEQGEENDSISDIKRNREEVQKAVQEASRARRAALEQAKEQREQALQELRDSLQTQREEFRTRLAEIQDERKQKIVENIDVMLARKNEVWTNHFFRVLDRLSALLDKLEDRADRAEENGKDVTRVRSAIADARASIEEARVVTDTQSQKVYTIEITDEESLGEAVSAAITELRTDLQAVRQKVAEAREAVGNVLRLLKTIVGQEDTVTPTQSET